MKNMDKFITLDKLSKQGIIAVVRGRTMEEGVKTAEACIDGGVKSIELAFTTPRAHEAIEILEKEYASDTDVIIGAGTVLEETTARLAILSGAKFIVSPALDEKTIRICNLYRVVSCPGVMSPEGVAEALAAGADIIKVFPGDIVGPKMVRDLHGPFPQADLMPSGGVSLENVADWLQAGCVAVSVGGSLIGAAYDGNFAEVTSMATKFAKAVAKARQTK